MEKGDIYRQIALDWFGGGVVNSYTGEVWGYKDGCHTPVHVANIWRSTYGGFKLVSPKQVEPGSVDGVVVDGHLVFARYDGRGNRLQEP
jgi:hypothetical protein